MTSASTTRTTRTTAAPRRCLLTLFTLPALVGLGLACTPNGEGVGATQATDETGASEASSGDVGESEGEGESSGEPGEPGDETTGGQALSCVPGSVVCADDGASLLTCGDDGVDLEAIPCAADHVCEDGACRGPCDRHAASASNEGCSFTTQVSSHFFDLPDGVTVTNPGPVSAVVDLFHTPRGTHKEGPTKAAIVIAPGASHTFTLKGEQEGNYSYYFTGDSYRVVSDRPVVAFQRGPIGAPDRGESGLLLPDHSLGLEYVVASAPAAIEPSYVTIVATEDLTTIEWTPPVDSAGSGFPIPFVAAGETGTLVMNRGDTVRIGASALAQTEPALRDLSGTILRADKPIAAVGGSVCAAVPFGVGPCNHLFEPLLPVAYWGRTYVGAPEPPRAEEPQVWRIYAGADDLTVTLDPPEAGEPIFLAARGEWVELTLEHGVGVVFTGDGPFLPVRSLAGAYEPQGEYGEVASPAMIQMVPVEQYRRRYAFATGVGGVHYAQILRSAGAGEVILDGEVVSGFVALGDHEVATVELSEGSHVASGADPFGVLSYGYDALSSYAHPAGLGLVALGDR